jgi:hypothetical protein
LKDIIEETREEYLQRTLNRKAHVEDAYFDDFRGPSNYRSKRLVQQNAKDHTQYEDDDNMSALTNPPVLEMMETKQGGETETDPEKKLSKKKKGII